MPRNYKQMKTAAEKRKGALEMRERGATLQQIADEYWPGRDGGPGSRSNAHKEIAKAIAAIPREAAETVRALEEARLDKLFLIAYTEALTITKKDPKTGEDRPTDPETRHKATLRALKIMERRAKLLGLDAPAQVHNLGDGIVNINFDPILSPTAMLEAVVEVDPIAD